MRFTKNLEKHHLVGISLKIEIWRVVICSSNHQQTIALRISKVVNGAMSDQMVRSNKYCHIVTNCHRLVLIQTNTYETVLFEIFFRNAVILQHTVPCYSLFFAGPLTRYWYSHSIEILWPC